MRFREPSVETNLSRIAGRSKRLRLWQHTFTIAALATLAVLLLGIAMIRGWLAETSLAIGLFALLAGAALLAWLVAAIKVGTEQVDRRRLAAKWEGADPRFLDRVNTLVFLEKKYRSDPARWFWTRIAGQTRGLLAAKQASVHFSPVRPLAHLGVFAILLATTIFVYQKYSPWQRMQAAQDARKARAARAQKKVPELALPTNNVAEENKPWGEVRITDPARDMKVTKVDVVPLQIEAAANQPLKKVGWFSTINGAAETSHELPPPPEPRYAVYQPTLYLDELRLADWDVLTYYANARAGPGGLYASDVYFLEVRPFREDILKLPGGEGGKAYQELSEMTSLIERQQHIIRQTHQYEQASQDQAKLREQDRKKLSGAEDDLGESVKHLYARMASEMENKPIGEALDNLARAEKSLGGASKSLQDDVMPEAGNRERSALAELVAARKIFQKAVSDNPSAFADNGQNNHDEPTPTAGDSKKLNDIAEFRNEAKAAQDFMQKAVEQQKQIAQKTALLPRNLQPPLADDENKLKKSLDDFQQQHPRVFHDVTNEFNRAAQSLGNAADSLQKKAPNAPANAQTAAQELEKLQTAMQNNATGRQLADAYRLKQMLDQQIKRLDQLQQSTNDIPDADTQRAAGNSRETLNQLRQVAENKPTSDAFGPQLRDSLTGANQSGMDSQLNQLAQAQGNDGKKAAAGSAMQGLQKVSQAFTQSQPSALQSAQKNDALKPGMQESFERGMAQLESMKQQMENGHQVPPEEEAKQRREALANLSDGLQNLYGSDQQAKQLLAELQQNLKDNPTGPLDLALLKKMMDQLRNFSIEIADKRDQNEKPDMTNIDPSHLPPAYRGRIEKYYQKLSEQKR